MGALWHTARHVFLTRRRRCVAAAFTTAIIASLTLAPVGCGGAAGTTSGGSGTAGGSHAGEAGPEGLGVVKQTEAGATYVEITPDELAGMLESKDFLLINVHVPYEGEIEPTDLFIPYDQAAARLSELPADRDAKIVVYCRSDHMSGIAVRVWADAGYTNLYDLDGGFAAWETTGYPLAHLDRP